MVAVGRAAGVFLKSACYSWSNAAAAAAAAERLLNFLPFRATAADGAASAAGADVKRKEEEEEGRRNRQIRIRDAAYGVSGRARGGCRSLLSAALIKCSIRPC